MEKQHSNCPQKPSRYFAMTQYHNTQASSSTTSGNPSFTKNQLNSTHPHHLFLKQKRLLLLRLHTRTTVLPTLAHLDTLRHAFITTIYGDAYSPSPHHASSAALTSSLHSLPRLAHHVHHGFLPELLASPLVHHTAESHANHNSTLTELHCP